MTWIMSSCTAFIHGDKQYTFNFLPFGLKNALAILMRIMKKVLGDLEFVKI